MRIIQPSVGLLTDVNPAQFLKSIEIAGRTCYKSEENITEQSAAKFVQMLIEKGHEAMLEHAPSISMKFVCDRGVSHEIVRHRLFSFAQESTRYCNYSKDKFDNQITVVEPFFFVGENAWKTQNYVVWEKACKFAEDVYFELLRCGASPQEARSVLPNSLKTEIVVTGNVREWLHFARLRTAPAAHPQMLQVATPAIKMLNYKLPEIFGQIPINQ